MTFSKETAPVLSLVVSVIALAMSTLTAWLTLLRRGSIKMTAPSTIFLGPDSGPPEHRKPKVYFRSLIYATSKRGRVVEGMYVKLRRNESAQNFSIWVYGESQLARGSGLYIGETGVVTNHHFLTPTEDHLYRYEPGTYKLDVFAHLVNRAAPLNLFSYELTITTEQAAALKDNQAGLYFDWAPEAQKYMSHVSTKALSRTDEGLEGLRLAYEMMKMADSKSPEETNE